MQFIENTRSTSSLIEYFRHFFIDMSIFGRHGGAPLEGEGKVASSLLARHGGQAVGRPRGSVRDAKTAPHSKRKTPRSQNEHGAPGKERLAAPGAGGASPAPTKANPTLTERAWGTRKGERPMPSFLRQDTKSARRACSRRHKGNGDAETRCACAGNPRVRE